MKKDQSPHHTVVTLDLHLERLLCAERGIWRHLVSSRQMTERSIPAPLTPSMQSTIFLISFTFPGVTTFHPRLSSSVHLLLLIDTVFARPTIDQQQESSNNRENLEEVVLGEVLVWMVLMKLKKS